jgi:hypothetical protein
MITASAASSRKKPRLSAREPSSARFIASSGCSNPHPSMPSAEMQLNVSASEPL